MKSSLRRFVALILGVAIVTASALTEESNSKSKRISERTFVRALDCLLNRDNDWFAPTFAGHKLLHVRYAYWSPDPDFRNEDALFVAAYKKGSREGELVHMVVKKEQQRRAFYIVNNTRFVFKNRRYELETPLGGLYTQGRIRIALKQMENRKDLEVSRDSVRHSNAECHWYGEERDPTLRK